MANCGVLLSFAVWVTVGVVCHGRPGEGVDSLMQFTPRRYGFKEDKCPDNSSPQRSETDTIIWCKTDSDCKESYTCTMIFGLRHFGTQINFCCPTKASVCTLPPQPGYGECGKQAQTMYYFDSTALMCLPFKVIECQGTNANRFSTLDDCRSRCETTACEAGETPLFKNDDADRPILCHEGGTCPDKHVCRYDKLFRRHVCCGYKAHGNCAAGQRPYMIPFRGKAQDCKESAIRDECPSDFVCAANPSTGKRHCCSLENGVCPAGQQAYIHPLTDNTIKCNPVAYGGSDCPRGFSCIASVSGAQWGFCCSDAVTATCPEGTKPLIHPLSQSPQKCTIGVSICGQGYQCQNADSTAIVGFCCTTPDTRPTRTFSSRRAGTLYSMEPPEVTLPPMAVVARPEEALLIEQWRPEIRLVDIQKEMDRINELTHKKNVLSRPLSTNQRRAPQQRTSNGPKCPSPMSPLMYMDTSLPLSCDLNSDTPCPAPAECTYAFNDPEFRTLCCLQNDFEDIDELFGVYTKYPAFEKRLTSTTSFRMPTTTPVPTTIRQTEATSRLPLSRPKAFVASSTDPLCPTVIEHRTCTPGSTQICIEDTFFCQFNIEHQQFMCCSLNSIEHVSNLITA